MPAGERVTLVNPIPERYRALWVRPQLEASLLRVRLAVERHVGGGQSASAIDEARAELAQLRAVGDVLPWVALRLSFEGMFEVLKRLQAQAPVAGNAEVADDVGLSAVVSACVLIPDYLDLLTRGETHSPLLLLPLINELRLAAGRALLGEAELVARQLAVQPWPLRRAPGKVRASQMPALARKAAPYYQSSLLAIMRAQSDSRSHWARLGKLAEQLAEATPATASHWLWSSMAAIVEAMLTEGLDLSIELKRHLGAVGQYLTQSGEAVPTADSDVVRLALTSLYYVARAAPDGRRVATLSVAWRLSCWVPSEAMIQQQRRRLQGVSPRLLGQVNREIRADLAEARDCIDLAIRTSDPAQVSAAVQALSQVADTLRGLGLRALGAHIGVQCERLKSLKLGRGSLEWEALATQLLRAEASLERELFAQTAAPRGDDHELGPMDDSQAIEASRMALMKVVLADFARAKGLLDTAFRHRSPEGLRDLHAQFEQMAASVSVIDRPILVRALRGIAELVRQPGLVTEGQDTAAANAFALLCARTELAMEALRDGLLVDADALPDLETELRTLQELLSVTVIDGPGPGVQPLDVVRAPTLPDDLDGELRDVFLEEADEVMATLDTTVPQWRRQPEPTDALITIRRAFHTLKGSGRMVGAEALGEFAWSVERLLNALLEGAEAIDPDVVRWVSRAHEVLPGVLQAYRDGQAVPEAALAVAEEAQQRLRGNVVTAQMRAVFRADATEKLDQVAEWLRAGDHDRVPESTIRAFHTLRGASNLVGLPALGTLAEHCEQWLQGLATIRQGPGEAGVALLDDLVTATRGWIAAAGSDQPPEIDETRWLERLREAQATVPDASQAAFAARQLIDTYSMEALDLLEGIESRAQAWQQDPQRVDLREGIMGLLHTLAGGASVSNAETIATVARALHARLTSRPLSAQGIAAVVDLGEGLRQLLDAYRQGRLPTAAPELLAAIAAIGADTPEQDVVPAQGPVDEQVAAAGDTAHDATAVGMPDDRLASPEIEAVVAAPADSAAEPVEDGDTELQEIFFAEAQELLDMLDRLSQQWSLQPESPELATETQRVLHTLKGSARVAGFEGLGRVAARLEAEVKSLQGQTPVASVFGRLDAVTGRLQHDLQALVGGDPSVFDAWRETPLLQVDPTAEAAAVEGVTESPVEPVVSPAPVAVSVQEAVSATADEDDAAVLRSIFSEEAVELLESIDAAYARWREQPSAAAPRDDLLRALHTLKGGARMCEWATLADAVHALESALERDQSRRDVQPAEAWLDEVGRSIRQLAELLELGGDAAHPVPVATASQPPARPVVRASRSWDPRLFFVPDLVRDGGSTRQETARVPVGRLDSMLNQVGEVSILRARLETQMGQAQSQLAEMVQSVDRLRDQLRQMDAETDAQIRARGMGTGGSGVEEDRYGGAFDPLEMDRYTRMQELSRSLNESLGDIAGLHDTLRAVVTDCESLLGQQDRANSGLQQGLMSALMVPFSRQVSRLQRVVRNTALELDKQVTLVVVGDDAELDRNVLERMTAPLEHVLRNAVVHGIESPAQRLARGKTALGTVRVALQRDGSELLMTIDDDGGGLDYDRIEAIAVRKGLIGAPLPADDPRREAELARFIFEPGFSTAEALSQTAGRGIGMDVVSAEVKQLGGGVIVQSTAGQGTHFEVRLPLTLAVSNALFVTVNGRPYALPLANIAGLMRISAAEAARCIAAPQPQLHYGGTAYQLKYLAELIGEPVQPLLAEGAAVQVVLLRMRDATADSVPVAVLPDTVMGNGEIIAKPVGPIIGAVNGVSSATILPDGQVVLILDAAVLSQARVRQTRAVVSAANTRDAPLVMVVDDSITIRRVTQRLLTRNGYRVVTAKDGLDALGQLASVSPAVVLLDIEMPRADGFEVASYIRNTERLGRTPIVMITSRSGDKHRSRAAAIGVNHYLIKPYQEAELVAVLNAFVSGHPS